MPHAPLSHPARCVCGAAFLAEPADPGTSRCPAQAFVTRRSRPWRPRPKGTSATGSGPPLKGARAAGPGPQPRTPRRGCALRRCVVLTAAGRPAGKTGRYGCRWARCGCLWGSCRGGRMRRRWLRSWRGSTGTASRDGGQCCRSLTSRDYSFFLSSTHIPRFPFVMEESIPNSSPLISRAHSR